MFKNTMFKICYHSKVKFNIFLNLVECIHSVINLSFNMFAYFGHRSDHGPIYVAIVWRFIILMVQLSKVQKFVGSFVWSFMLILKIKERFSSQKIHKLQVPEVLNHTKIYWLESILIPNYTVTALYIIWANFRWLLLYIFSLTHAMEISIILPILCGNNLTSRPSNELEVERSSKIILCFIMSCRSSFWKRKNV